MTDSKHTEGGSTGTPPPYAFKHSIRAICTFLLLLCLTILILWLIYRPSKPKFNITNAAIFDINTTSPPFLSITVQFTVNTRNSNKRVSYIYDRLSAILLYRNQVITPPVVLPPMYHEPKGTITLSPILGGVPVPVSPEVSNGLAMDEVYGAATLRLVMMGKLRYKAGSIRTRRYAIYVKCDILVGWNKEVVSAATLLASPGCKVDI